jgi:hypothetical protein
MCVFISLCIINMYFYNLINQNIWLQAVIVAATLRLLLQQPLLHVLYCSYKKKNSSGLG